MTRDEFAEQMGRLRSRWKQTYDDEIAKLIWREVQEMPGHWWAKTVDDFIGSSRQPPLLPEIRERRAAERERAWSHQKHQAPPQWTPPPNARCLDCRDSGLVFAAQKGTGNPYVFLCGCTAGRADRRAFPRWTSALLDQFDVLEAA